MSIEKSRRMGEYCIKAAGARNDILLICAIDKGCRLMYNTRINNDYDSFYSIFIERKQMQ